MTSRTDRPPAAGASSSTPPARPPLPRQPSPAGEPPAADAPSRPSMGRTALVLGAFVAVGPLTIDMYLPALPTIGAQLETTEAAVQLTLTGTLVGLALGQLVIGPLSDALGRRRPLMAGTALHVLASLLVLLAPNIAVLGALRVLQGVGTAAGAVIALAIVRDLYEGRAAATMLSRLFLVIGAAPVLAPTIGGEVLRFTSWRGIFLLLAVYGLLLLALGARSLRETLPPEDRRPLRLGATVQTYRGLLRDRTYLGLVLVAGLTMAALFSYVAGASFVYQDQFGLDQQQFGLLFGAGAVWLIGATQLNPLALRRFTPSQVLMAGTFVGLLAGAVLLVLATTGTGGLLGVALPLWLVLFSTGLALPNAPALALSRHGEAAGAAAALLGAVQFGVGALVSPLVGVLGNDARAMAAVILTALVLGTAVLLVVVRPWRLVADADPTAVVAH
ncbi:multidrug effflux MFS transporter [Kineococcus sp. SYSU DK006]|uniref:multidrug effflux MFS transporter n=1 Tax=Kineococcus sp. SYSU DK006 TaxID=3383127 RepID=UPI003D7D988F